MNSQTQRHALRGSTIIELLIAMTLFTVVLLASMAMIDSGRDLSIKTMAVSSTEDLSQQMLYGLERELANAHGHEPIGVLGVALTAGSNQIVADSTIGFPPRGVLILDRGTANEERVLYDSLNANRITFQQATRGFQGTAAVAHAFQSSIEWSGLAEPIVNQVNPQPGEFDGIVQELGQQVFYRGDGTGFSYRTPIDPGGGTNYVNGNDLNWGAEISGIPTLDGWNAIFFEPRGVFDETDTGEDINKDGDSLDVFDVGQLRRIRWDTTNPALVQERGLGPTAILQERNAWGSDLDADGFQDPLFMWDKTTNELHVRLFLLGRSKKDMPVVRKVESVMFLRNEPEL